MDDDAYLRDELRLWKCPKHPHRRRLGVCPKCLRDRLLLLCPDCAHERPCGCLRSSPSASSPFSSYSFDYPRSSIGAVGRVGSLIDDEPAFLRSRSAAFRFLRPRSDSVEGRRRGGRRWASFWPFSKDAAQSKEKVAVPEKLLRSRSVATTSSSGTGGGDGGNIKGRGWHWRLPNPINAFRHRKSAKVVQERSPFRRGRSVKTMNGTFNF